MTKRIARLEDLETWLPSGRMRSIYPKVNIYHGPILTKDSEQCTTDKDLDLVVLATREFWFESPPDAGLVPRYPLQKPPSRGLEGSGGEGGGGFFFWRYSTVY